jgi:hypothetical protein
MIASARMDGGSRYGALHLVYEDLTYRLELDESDSDHAQVLS